MESNDVPEDVKKIVEQYATAVTDAMNKQQEKQQLESMLGAQQFKPSRVAILRYWLQTNVLFWFEILTWPTLVLILWRVWR